jgi:ribonuclease P protein component
VDKAHTVKKNEDFYKIIHKGFYAKDNLFTIYNKDNGLDIYRFGISISKKLGNSVKRNYYKRQVRFLIDKYKKNYQIGFDYIIIIRKDFINTSFSDKEISFLNLINKINSHNKGVINDKKEI